MGRTLAVLWAVLALAMAVICLLALAWGRQREAAVAQRVNEVLLGQLEPDQQRIDEVFDDYSIALQRELGNCQLNDLQQCLAVSRFPLIQTLVVVDTHGEIRFPTNVGSLPQDRQALIAEALQLMRDTPTATINESQRTMGLSSPDARAARTRRSESDWLSWYHGRGIVLGFLWEQHDHWRCLAIVPPARWKSDVINSLPDNRQQIAGYDKGLSGDSGEWFKKLVDVEGKLVYQWGPWLPREENAEERQTANASLPLESPLEAWRLEIYASEKQRRLLGGADSNLSVGLAAVAVSVALVLAGTLVSVNLNRQSRQATQRVSFVNQVSHELRTPLTNIRMYADLLAESLRQSDDELESNRQLDKVSIIQNESQRLSRLINNVLQFARPHGNQRTLQLELAVIDDIVRDVVASFRPRLESLGFEIQLDLAVTERRSLDADAVEQILINLVSNSEKYAAGGKWLSIITRSSDEQVEILVTDRGPGIPPRFAEKIFDPFVRISDRIESPAGTGIGLAIVRQLARLHGGDCRLVASQGGACFSCILHAKSDRPR